MATEIKTLEPVQTLAITTQPQNYVNAMTQLASSSTLLGNLGVKMAQNASQTYQQLRGIEAGKEPSGNLLPPITDADAAFVKGYSAQAEQTLGLQAQQLLQKGQLELSKNYQLSNSSIQSYSKNMQQGLQQIIEQAPYTIKSNLANQYTAKLEQNVFSLNNQLISQQKRQEKQNSDLYLANQAKNITDLALSGRENANKQSRQTYDQTIGYINAKEKSGLLTPGTAEAKRQELKQLYLSNELSRQAIDASKGKNLEPFLNSLTEVPNEFAGIKVGFTDWSNARNSALRSVQNYEMFTQREQNLLISEAKVKMENNSFGPTDIDELRSNLDPIRFNDFYSQFLHQQNKTNQAIEQTNFLAANAQNPIIMSRASNKEINQTFDALTNSELQKAQDSGVPISLEEAQFKAQSTMAVSSPSYTNQLATQLSNPNPSIAINAAQTIQRLYDTNQGEKLSPELRSSDSRLAHLQHAITELLPFAESEQQAVEMARGMIYQTKEEMQFAQSEAQKWSNKHSSANQLQTFARSFVNLPRSVAIPNQGAFNISVANAYKDALVYFKGNSELAKSFVQKGVNQNYGATNVNGRPEFIYMPIEKVLNKDERAIPLIQDDVYEQVKMHVDNMKTVYDMKGSTLDFYYELPERIDYNKFSQAKLNKSADSSELQKKYLSGEPIKIFKVLKRTGEKIPYTIEVKPSPFISLTNPGDPTLGGYDINLRNESGGLEQMNGTFGNSYTSPNYRPNINKINERYGSVSVFEGEDFQSAINRFLSQKTGTMRLLESGKMFR